MVDRFNKTGVGQGHIKDPVKVSRPIYLMLRPAINLNNSKPGSRGIIPFTPVHTAIALAQTSEASGEPYLERLAEDSMPRFGKISGVD